MTDFIEHLDKHKIFCRGSLLVMQDDIIRFDNNQPVFRKLALHHMYLLRSIGLNPINKKQTGEN